MDLNRLYFDHQMLLLRARIAGAGQARQAHETAARRLAGRIGSFQRRSGAAAALGWETLALLPGAALCAALTAQERGL